MTNREKRIVRKEWKKRSKRYRENKKKKSEMLQQILIDSSPPPTPTPSTSNNDLIEEGGNSKSIGMQEKKTVPTCEPQLFSKPSTSRELRLSKFLDEEATSSNVPQKHKRNKKEECGNSAVGSWVAVIYDNLWGPGVVEKEKNNMVTVKFMKVI